MRTIKSNEQVLLDAAQMIKDGNRAVNIGEKQVKIGKEVLSRWLKEERKIDLEALGIGEMVCLEGCCLIEIAGTTRFDEAAFAVANPEAHASFKRERPVKKFKPLV